MHSLLLATFQQHPNLARILLDTGDARLYYVDPGSLYWTCSSSEGSNWVGRLLGVVRSELAAAHVGLPAASRHHFSLGRTIHQEATFRPATGSARNTPLYIPPAA
jgi:hypothetical protein